MPATIRDEAAPAHARHVRDHCLAPSRSVDAPFAYGGKYGRLFPDLPPLECEDPALLALGDVGGLCDGAATTGDGAVPAGWSPFSPCRHQTIFVICMACADCSG